MPDFLLRLLADRRFQRWAARFPLTRPVARRNTRALFDLCAGFIYAQVLAACVQLDVFELVAAQPRTASDLSKIWAMPADAAACLLQAAVALRLLSRRSADRFGLGLLGAALRGNPAVSAMITHHALLYEDLRDPVGLLRQQRGATQLGRYWAYAGSAAPGELGGAATGDYTGLMAASQPIIADEVLSAYDFRPHRCLLDVGGGDGSFLAAVAEAAPSVQLMLFDLPSVASAAQLRLGERATCVGGDFRGSALPSGADIVSFVRVLHDHDDATVAHLLRLARAALPVGGRVLIAEPMADDPSAAAYFGVYLRAMGSGRPRFAAELIGTLAAAGFEHCRLLSTPTPLLARVIVARCKS
jgi:demethylspheroidene O-methyltransferase